MALNIKNERVCRLAKQAAELTGQSQVSALEQALEALIADVQRDRERERRVRLTRELIEEGRGTVTDEDREWTRRFMEEMYDEDGLPR
ncbi:MAG TPA: type II toxin-antitoxin system VapB family antitoxin [Dermatophilaceae bacterium]|nr:type II toxin-antitoxin system VapB family antitoxin [Dermatophilaceae bacterium]